MNTGLCRKKQAPIIRRRTRNTMSNNPFNRKGCEFYEYTFCFAQTLTHRRSPMGAGLLMNKISHEEDLDVRIESVGIFLPQKARPAPDEAIEAMKEKNMIFDLSITGYSADHA